MTYVQGTKTFPCTLNLQSTVVVSGDVLFKLWQDAEMTRPVTDIRWEAVKTQAVGGIREFLRVKTLPIFVHNITEDTLLSPIAPCAKLQLDGVGAAANAHFETLPEPDGKTHDLGDSCQEDWPSDWWLNPGEKWIMQPEIQFDQAPQPGKYNFPVVVGVLGRKVAVPKDKNRCRLPLYVTQADVSVVSDQVTDVSFAEPGFSGKAPDPQRFGPVTDFFAFIKDAIDQKASRINVKFHLEFGYPMDTFVDYGELRDSCSRRGSTTQFSGRLLSNGRLEHLRSPAFDS